MDSYQITIFKKIQIFLKDKKVIKRAVELLNEEKLSYETELAESKEREARGDGDLKGIGKEIETILARLPKFFIWEIYLLASLVDDRAPGEEMI